MIRVLIRAPSAVARAGLESLIRLDPLLHIVEDPPSAASHGMREPIEDREPDVIVIQVENTPDGRTGNRAFTSALTDIASGIRLILLVPDDATEWNAAFRQGARAVLSSRASGEQIVAAIHAVAAGLRVFQPFGSGDFIEALVREVPEKLPEALTPREIEVLRLMALGLGNKEIASRLNISEHTAKFHVASIMGKLGAENRTEAVMSGIHHGLVLI